MLPPTPQRSASLLCLRSSALAFFSIGLHHQFLKCPILYHAPHAFLASCRYSIDRACLPPSRILSTTRVSVFTPADAVPLHHCSIRLQPLLLEHPHPTGSRLHLAELLRLAAADSSHVLHQQHLDRVAHVLGNRAFARTSSNMFCRFPRSSTVAPTFCTSRVHRTSASSLIFAPPSNRVAIMLSIAT